MLLYIQYWAKFDGKHLRLSAIPSTLIHHGSFTKLFAPMAMSSMYDWSRALISVPVLQISKTPSWHRRFRQAWVTYIETRSETMYILQQWCHRKWDAFSRRVWFLWGMLYWTRKFLVVIIITLQEWKGLVTY